MNSRDLQERTLQLRRFLEDRNQLANLIEAKLLSGCTAKHRVIPNQYNLFTLRLYECICKFSLGVELEEIESDIRTVVDHYERIDSIYGTPKSKEAYCNHLWLVAMAVLLDLDGNAMERIGNKWSEIGAEDRFIDTLLAKKLGNAAESKQLLFPDTYELAVQALEKNSPDSSCKALLKYLKIWHGGHRGCHWHNMHNAKEIGYMGYWSFESAAIAKVNNIDVSGSGLGSYFPYSFFGLPELAQTAKEVRKMKKIVYPGLPSLTFLVPNNFIDESKERLSLISSDQKMEVAGTVYGGSEESLEAFTTARDASFKKKLSWYSLISKRKGIEVAGFSAYVMDYEGIWPNETEATYCRVVTCKFDSHFFALNFTCLKKLADQGEDFFDKFLENISFSKSL